jgi:hypothetical protein
MGSDWAMIILTGVLGGLTNCLLAGGGSFLRPKIGRGEINPGFIGNIFLGIFASFVVYGLAIPEITGPKKVAICLLAAAGGGNVIMSLLQRKELMLEEKKTQATSGISRRLLEKQKQQKSPAIRKHPEPKNSE